MYLDAEYGQSAPMNLVHAILLYGSERTIRLATVHRPINDPQGGPPLLDAGAAVDVALRWCDSALAAVDGRLAGVASASTDAALLHHFRSATPSTAELTFIRGHMANIRARVAAIPEDFFWSETLPGDAAASTVSFRQGTVPPPHSRSITISNLFSTFHGPNGRAAVLIHEAAHFEIGGRPDGTAPHIGEASPEYATMSAADARENPSSYASFAQETFFGVDHRFGAGRPGE